MSTVDPTVGISEEPSVPYRRSGIVISADEVIAYCDRLEEHMTANSEGNRFRGLTKAIIAAEMSAIAGGDALGRVIGGGIDVVEAAVIVLRDRLRCAISDALPVPYELVEEPAWKPGC